MYRLLISYSNDELLDKYGISTRSKEVFIKSESELVEILCRLSHLNLMYSVVRVSFSSVDDVCDLFASRSINM